MHDAYDNLLLPAHAPAPRRTNATITAIMAYTTSSAVAIGCVRRRYNTANPIDKTITCQIRNRSIMPSSFAKNDLSSSIGSSTASVVALVIGAAKIVERHGEQLRKHPDRARMDDTVKTCLNVAFPPMAALKIAYRMPEMITMKIGHHDQHDATVM